MVTATPQAGVQDVAFEPLSAAFAQNPYPAYAALRARGTPQFFADFDMWLVTRFDDVAAIARDNSMVRSPEFFMSAEEVHEQKRLQNWLDMPHHERFVQFSMLDSDGEVHDRLRKQVFREFTPAFIARQRGMIQSFVDRLVDSLIDKGEIDFVEDLAAQVPGHIIGRVLGVPDEDCPQLRGWSEKVVQFFDIDRSDERKALAEQATTEFYHYLQKLMAERRKAPQEDLITRLMAAEDAGHLNEDELVSTCMLILMAGHGSTIDVLGSGMHALLRFPDQMARLKADPGLIHTAIQEMFRFEIAAALLPPLRHPGHGGRRPGFPARHQVRPALRRGQPRPGAVPEPRQLRRRPQPQPAPRLRRRRPFLPRQPSGAARHGGDLHHAHQAPVVDRAGRCRTAIQARPVRARPQDAAPGADARLT